MTCPITADRDAWRGCVTEREAALVEALEEVLRRCSMSRLMEEEIRTVLSTVTASREGV